MNTFGYNSGGAIKETCFAGIVKRKTAEARKKEGSIKKLVEEWFSNMMIEFSDSDWSNKMRVWAFLSELSPDWGQFTVGF